MRANGLTKADSEATPQFCLIAEEVAEVNPDLVVRAKNGGIYRALRSGERAVVQRVSERTSESRRAGGDERSSKAG